MSRTRILFFFYRGSDPLPVNMNQDPNTINMSPNPVNLSQDSNSDNMSPGSEYGHYEPGSETNINPGSKSGQYEPGSETLHILFEGIEVVDWSIVKSNPFILDAIFR